MVGDKGHGVTYKRNLATKCTKQAQQNKQQTGNKNNSNGVPRIIQFMRFTSGLLRLLASSDASLALFIIHFLVHLGMYKKQYASIVK